MRQPSAYDEEVRDLSLPSCTNENLACQLLIAGGGLSGLNAAEAAVRSGLDVIVIDKGIFGKDGASGLNAGQFLTGWAKSVEVMLAELALQEQRSGVSIDQAELRARRRVSAFLRRTVEGCQRLGQLDHEFNLRASVTNGALMAAMNDADMASLQSAYHFMTENNFRTLMPREGNHRQPFFELLSAPQIESRCGSAEGFYAGGVIDYFGGSFRPRKLLIGLVRALRRRGVRFFQLTEAQALDFSDKGLLIYCGNGATIRADALFMANSYARHINGDVLERTIFEYDHVVQVELPEGARTLAGVSVLADMRDPCFYARRHGRNFYMGYEELAETSPEIVEAIARRTLDEGKRIFPELRGLQQADIKSAWAGRVYYTLDDYPLLERRHGGRLISFAAPSDHGNALASRVGQLVGEVIAQSLQPSTRDDDMGQHRRNKRYLRLFETFPKGLRMRPGRRYQEAAFMRSAD